MSKKTIYIKGDSVECKVGDILKLKNGYAFKSSKYKNEGIPVLRIGDIQDWNVSIDNAKRIEENAEYDNNTVNKGDILIAMSGATTGKFGIYNSDLKAYQNQRVGNLIPHSEDYTIKKYIYYLLYSLKREIEKKAYGGAQPNISAKKIESLNTKLFPVPIQHALVKKIESLFSSLDQGITDLKKAQKQLKTYRQAVLKKAFEGEFTNTSLKINNLEQYIHSVEYGTSRKSLKDGKVPVLRMGNMQNGGIDWRDLKYTDNKKDIEKYLLRKGDVLFNRTNSPEHVGKTSIYLNDRKAIFAGYLIRINYDVTKIVGKYLNYYLNSFSAKIYGNKVKTDGVNQSNINGTKLKKYPFPYCSTQEQHAIIREIESRLSVCDAIEKTIAESLEKAESLRQSILKQAFEGRLLSEDEVAECKNHPDYEPTEKLLEKIKAEKKKKK